MYNNQLFFNNKYKSKNYFFKVYEEDIYYPDPRNTNRFLKYPEKKLIINSNIGKAISIVPRYFNPVEHEDAFNFGITIFELLFGVSPTIQSIQNNKKGTDFKVDFISENCKIIFNRRGYKFINNLDGYENDRIHNRTDEISESNLRDISTSNYISERYQDVYYPFVRVSNYLRGYNSFFIEVGYYRSKCSNGLLFGRKTKMSFKSSYRNDFHQIKRLALDKFLKNKSEILNLADSLWKLLKIHVPKAKLRLITYDIFKDKLKNKKTKDKLDLQLQLQELVDKYVSEIGENLNAALNIATEFSQKIEGQSVSPSSIQNLASSWLNIVTKKDFNLNKYLLKIENIEQEILKPKEEEI